MANKQARIAQKIINMQPVKASTISTAMKSFSSVKQKVERMAKNAVAVILRNKANNRYHYGEFDNLPNVIISAVDNSGTATACVNRLSQFIQADGFIAEGLDKVKVNSKQTLGNILSEQSQNVAYIKGYALRLVFNVEGKIAKIYNIDIKTLRKVGGGFEYNPLMGEVGKDETETRLIPEFDSECDPATRRMKIAKQIKDYGEQWGEVLYVFKKGMGRYYDIYPVPDFYSSIEDIISDGKISQLDLRNITQGFRTPVVISTGPIDDQNEDEDGNTAQDYFDQALESFTGEDASPILHLKGATDEFKPTVTVINLAEILDQTDKTSDRIAKRVARNMGVPSVLIGISTEGKLGDVQELKNQMSLFALSVYHLQALIKEGYDQIKPFLALQGMEVIQDLDFTISTLRPFDFIPDSVIANLTSEEQKEMFEIDFESDLDYIDDEEVASRFAEFGVGGVQGILGIQTAVSENTIDILAGVKVLEIIYGLQRADAFQVLGGTEDQLTGDIISMNDKPTNNDALANLTGRQMQNIQRIVRKFNKGELTADQAKLMIQKGFGLDDDDVALFIVDNESDTIEDLQNLACPVATQDLQLNTKNRNHAIQADYIQYGPLNVKQPEDYWQEIAEHWDTSEEAAKQSNCSNCAAFDISKRMLNCMPGALSDDDGNLGYCHMHKFKCHSARSCYTWAAGGAITTDQISTEWQERSSDVKALLKNQTYNDYPKAASENAQAALRWAENNGWGSCGTDVGKQRANQLAKGESISRDTIARMAAFERHRGNSDKALGDGCGRLMWLAWGGDAGVEWAQRKLEQIDNE